jgi:hypothetical protein
MTEPWRPFQNCRRPPALSDFDIWISGRRLLDDGNNVDETVAIMQNLNQQLRYPMGRIELARKVRRVCEKKVPDLCGDIGSLL